MMIGSAVLFLLMIFFSPDAAESVETIFLTSGSVRVRALSMASAYHSIEDDFSAGMYNPGAFRVNASRNERPLRIYFNPVGATVGLYDFSKHDLDFTEDNGLVLDEVLYSLATVLKGAVFTTPLIDIGIGLQEEIIPADSTAMGNNRFFSVENMSMNTFHTAFFSVKIAPSVSIGMSKTLYSRRSDGKNTYKSGHTFGVLLNPNPKMKVGIAYNFFPEGFSEARYGLESLENETITSGISYYPDQKTILSLDLRNLNREDKTTSREIHTGIERKILEKVALRAGYYRKKSTKHDVFSFGIGILPGKEKISKFATTSRNDSISYTVLVEEDGFKRRWHMFSLLLRY